MLSILKFNPVNTVDNLMEKFEVLLRLRAIEMIAYWEGRLITNQLVSNFGISRQQASNDIKLYLTKYNLNGLEYVAAIKGYRPTKSFSPVLTEGHINEYMDLLSTLVKGSTLITFIDKPKIAAVQLPDRAVKPEIVQKLIQASQSERSLVITYASMNNPLPHKRIISPHTMIYSGFRWHVRAYCHMRNDFRDFLISRISSLEFSETTPYQDNEIDHFWNDQIKITLKPNNNLSTEQQELIKMDFNMKGGFLEIEVKKALAHYTLHRYQAAVTEDQAQNQFQYPLVLAESNEVHRTLFSKTNK